MRNEVVINGKPNDVLNCEEAVLRVAEGNLDGLNFVELRHEARQGLQQTVA